MSPLFEKVGGKARFWASLMHSACVSRLLCLSSACWYVLCAAYNVISANAQAENLHRLIPELDFIRSLIPTTLQKDFGILILSQLRIQTPATNSKPKTLDDIPRMEP